MFGEPKCVGQNLKLLFGIVGWPDGIAERQVGKGKARNSDLVDDVAG